MQGKGDSAHAGILVGIAKFCNKYMYLVLEQELSQQTLHNHNASGTFSLINIRAVIKFDLHT